MTEINLKGTAESSSCLHDEQFAAWQADALSEAERESAVEHTASCARCRAILGELVRSDGDDDDSRIGRYEIVETLGSGGMGVVLRAYDPLLSREVAVKVCRQRADVEMERQALLGEARKLALVRHPNVVPVYDVGLQRDEIYIAMELVDGVSLDEWAAAGPRPLEQRFEIARGIGRGLTAIHESGLVHRDLKPSNVMVRGDGGAVIVDLGLAEFRDLDGGEAPRPAGTRGYLPPEVRAGAIASPRSDQYQWWSLMRDPLALEAELPWLPPLVGRGMSEDPADRFESVQAGLDAIGERAARTGRRPIALIALVIAALAVAIGGGLWMRSSMWPRDAPALATDCAAKVGWKPETRARVEANLRAHGAPAAAVVELIDERAARAQALSTKLCRAAAGQTDPLAWRRRECVLAAWRDTAASIRELRDGDGAAVVSTIDDLATLLPLDRCDKGTVLAVEAPLSPEARRASNEALRALSEAMSDPQMSSSDQKKKLETLRQALSALENPAVMARWHVEVGRVYATQANGTEAAAEFATAYRLATEAGDDELAAATLVMQLTVVSNDTSADAVKQLEDHARAAVDRVGNPFWSSQLRRAIATRAMVAGSLELAVSEFRAGIEELRTLRIQPHQMELSMMQNLGAVLLESGDPSGAEAVLAEAVGGAKLRWATHQPELYLTVRAAHATALLAMGKTAAAADAFGEVASGLESIGATPIQRGKVQSYRSAALMSLKRMDEARTAAEQAVELIAADAGESSILVWPLLAAAQVALGQSDWTAGRQHLVRAQSICSGGSCRDIEVLVLKAYLAIALKRTGDARAGMRLAREVAAKLEQPGFEQARRDVAEAFPALSKR